MGALLIVLLGWGLFGTFVEVTSKPDYQSRPIPKVEKMESSRNLNGHLFPTTMLFNSPIPSSRFGFLQGGGISKTTTLEQIGDKTVKSKETYGALIEGFDIGAKFSNKLSLDLAANINLGGGIDGKDVFSAQVSPFVDIKGGPTYKLYQSKRGLLVSLSSRMLYQKGITVSMNNGLEASMLVLNNKVANIVNDADFQVLLNGLGNSDSILPEDMQAALSNVFSRYKNLVPDLFKTFTKNLISKDTAIGAAPAVGVAYPITKWLGYQTTLEYVNVKVKQETKDTIAEGTKNWFNINSALSLDFRQIMNCADHVQLL